MSRKKVIKKIKNIFENYRLSNVSYYISILAPDQAYYWILYLIRINKSYEFKPIDWKTLIEIYIDKISIFDKEILRYKQQKNSGNNQIYANPDNTIHSLDKSINSALISLTIEDIQLHPILRNFRNDDYYREEMMLKKDNPTTRNQYIAHLKGVKSYYERRRKEMEAFLEFSDQSQGITSKILNELHSALPLSKQSKLKQKPRGAGKIKPSFELTNELIEQCLADKYYYDENDRPVRYRIIQSVLSQLEKIFRNENTPGFTENLTESGVDYRVKKYLKEH